jgi:hypothetical protein
MPARMIHMLPSMGNTLNWENMVTDLSIATTPRDVNWQIQIKANEVCRVCGTHGRWEKRVQGFGGKAQRKEITQKTKA